MKKLMIAAAAAAMIGGAFADDAITIKYNQVGTNEALQVYQVLQYKIKAGNGSKTINLNGEKKLFGKTLKYKGSLAVDGVYYYVGNGKWYNFEWNKEEVLVAAEVSAPAFDIFENDDANKALAVFSQAWSDWWRFPAWSETWKEDAKTGMYVRDGGAEAYSYGALKYTTEKDEAGKKVKKLDTKVKSIKAVDGSVKYTIKTFKDTKKKDVQTQVNEYIAKLLKKAPKAKAK